MKHYTVVGLYDDNTSYVEGVECAHLEDAYAEAIAMDADRQDGRLIAVFQGFHDDHAVNLVSCARCNRLYNPFGDGWAGLCPDCADEDEEAREIDEALYRAGG